MKYEIKDQHDLFTSREQYEVALREGEERTYQTSRGKLEEGFNFRSEAFDSIIKGQIVYILGFITILGL